MGNGLVAADILEQVERDRYVGDVFRVMINDYPPEKENTVGARWNPKGTAAIYTSTSADQAIAEIRYKLATQPRPVRADLRLVVYRIHVEIAEVVDLAKASKALENAGIDIGRLISDSWTDSQAIGNTIVWLGRGALLVPSARGSEKNLVIYPSTAGAYQFEAQAISRIKVQ